MWKSNTIECMFVLFGLTSRYIVCLIYILYMEFIYMHTFWYIIMHICIALPYCWVTWHTYVNVFYFIWSWKDKLFPNHQGSVNWSEPAAGPCPHRGPS